MDLPQRCGIGLDPVGQPSGDVPATCQPCWNSLRAPLACGQCPPALWPAAPARPWAWSRGCKGVPDFQFKILNPASAKLGTSGASALRPADVTPMARSLPAFTCACASRRQQRHLQLAAQHGRRDLGIAGIRHVHGLIPLRDFSSSVPIWPTVPTPGAIAPLVPSAACRCQKFAGTRCGCHARLAHRRSQYQRRGAHQRQRRKILQRVVRHRWVDQLGDRHVAVDHQPNGVVVPGLGHGIGADVATRTHLVFDDDRLSQGFGQGSEKVRAVRSGDEPGGKPTMIFSGFVGQGGGAGGLLGCGPWCRQSRQGQSKGGTARKQGLHGSLSATKIRYPRTMKKSPPSPLVIC